MIKRKLCTGLFVRCKDVMEEDGKFITFISLSTSQRVKAVFSVFKNKRCNNNLFNNNYFLQFKTKS